MAQTPVQWALAVALLLSAASLAAPCSLVFEQDTASRPAALSQFDVAPAAATAVVVLDSQTGTARLTGTVRACGLQPPDRARVAIEEAARLRASNSLITVSGLALGPADAAADTEDCVTLQLAATLAGLVDRSSLTIRLGVGAHFNMGGAALCAATVDVVVAGVNLLAVDVDKVLSAPGAARLVVPEQGAALRVRVVSADGKVRTGSNAAAVVRVTEGQEFATVDQATGELRLDYASVRDATLSARARGENLAVSVEASSTDSRVRGGARVILDAPVEDWRIERVDGLDPVVAASESFVVNVTMAGGAVVGTPDVEPVLSSAQMVLAVLGSSAPAERVPASKVSKDTSTVSFDVPPLDRVGIGELQWSVSVPVSANPGAMRVSVSPPDTISGTVVARRPRIVRVSPDVALVRDRPVELRIIGENFIGTSDTSLLPTADAIPTIEFNSVPVPPEDVLFVSDTIVDVRTPVLDVTEPSVTLGLTSAVGLPAATPLAVTVEPPLEVLLTVLLSSYDKGLDMFVLPVVCGRTNTPVLLASAVVPANAEAGELPTFEFEFRVIDPGTSNPDSQEYRPLDTGSSMTNTLVALNEPGLFGSAQPKEGYVEVRVRARHAAGSGVAMVRISRRLEEGTAGVSIVPPLSPKPLGATSLDDDVPAECDAADAPIGTPAVVDATFSSALHCPSPDQLETTTAWTVNGETAPPMTDRVDPRSVRAPTSLGFGSGILLPDTGEGTKTSAYGVRVTFVDRETGDIVASGEAADGELVTRSIRPVAQINSGESEIRLQPGETLTLTAVDAADSSDANISYTWTCTLFNDKTAPRGEGLACDTDMLPSSRDQTFEVDTGAIADTALIRYTLQLSRGNLVSRVSTLDVVFLPDSGGSPLQHGTIVYTSSGALIVSSNPCRRRIQSHENLFVTPNCTHSGAMLSYALFNSNDENVLSDEIIIGDGSRFWSLSDDEGEGTGKLLSIRVNTLEAGDYKLRAAVNASSSTLTATEAGTTWAIEIAPAPVVSVSRVPVTEGVARETVFYVAANAEPALGSTFFFALRTEKGDPLETPITPDECLGGCTGNRAVSFTVDEPGTYFVQIDVVGLTSEVVKSMYAVESITVAPAQDEPTSENVQRDAETIVLNVLAARSQNDESKFLEAAELYGKNLNITTGIGPENLPAQVSLGLRSIALWSLLPPMRASRIVYVAQSLLAHPRLLPREALQVLYDVNEAAGLRITAATSGPHMASELVKFYEEAGSWIDVNSMATSRSMRTSEVRQRKSQDETPMNGSSTTGACAEMRAAAAADITLAMSRGRECGFSETLTIGKGDSAALRGEVTTSVSCGAFKAEDGLACCINRDSGLLTDPTSLIATGVVSLSKVSESTGIPEGLLLSSSVRAQVLKSDAGLMGEKHVPFRGRVDGCSMVNATIVSSEKLRSDAAAAFDDELVVSCEVAVSLYAVSAAPLRARDFAPMALLIDPTPRDSQIVRFHKNGTLTVAVPLENNIDIAAAINDTLLTNCASQELSGHNNFWIAGIVIANLLCALLFALCVLGLWCGYTRRSERRGVKVVSAAGPGGGSATAETALFGLDEAMDAMASKTTDSTWGDAYDAAPRQQRIFYDEDDDGNATPSSSEIALQPNATNPSAWGPSSGAAAPDPPVGGRAWSAGEPGGVD